LRQSRLVQRLRARLGAVAARRLNRICAGKRPPQNKSPTNKNGAVNKLINKKITQIKQSEQNIIVPD